MNIMSDFLRVATAVRCDALRERYLIPLAQAEIGEVLDCNVGGAYGPIEWRSLGSIEVAADLTAYTLVELTAVARGPVLVIRLLERRSA